MGRLSIDPGGFGRWNTLSPGERKRWQLAAALASNPHVLLLDEPTNHLDADGRGLVEAALERFAGVGLVISHDRGFLDRLTQRTLQVTANDARLWSGSYSSARQAWQQEERAATERYRSARREEKALRRRLADERRAAEGRNARFQRTLRSADPKDHDATSMAARGRHETGNVAGQRRRTVIRAEMERAGAMARALSPGASLGSGLFFDFEASPKRTLLQFAGPLRAGEIVLADDLDLAVERKDRIRLVGPNGAGKSTLLRALLDGAKVPAERLLYLPQELTRDAGAQLLRSLDRVPADRRGRVLAIVAALGVDPDELLVSDRPSPGEARKLAIALGLGGGAWGLLLDEPTNHLDLPAVERVESALDAYPGAVILITHDETFGAEVTSMRWHLEDGTLSVSTTYPGP